MDGYSYIRRIESTNHVRDICVRFYGLKSGTDIWLDAQALYQANPLGSVSMATFLRTHCEIEEDVAERIANADWEVVAAEGLCERCLTQPKGFDWEMYEEISDARSDYADEIVLAAIACDVPLSLIQDRYIGEFKDWESFVKERWDELYKDEVPEFLENYIDYDKITVDWKAGGEYSEDNNHFFATS
ncbi:putative antirestriction protein [Erwinia phage Fifi44]|uniref:Antirestriction protein n=1 Tax=Erwinia phage Fifi44 TaxID=2876597 RepID=A0AAE8Y1L6_9CAUD|nr:putative antirestriction protein [Erwinia phage Fifi44]UCR74891.1 putative antirestriction protein [Erwinia phage Fifi44]UCR80875.1 putative antirestriction protein [Erwinia phage Fifi451]